MNQDDFEIQTERFILKIIKESNRLEVFETMNNPHTANILSFLNWPVTLAHADKWCEQSVKGFAMRKDFFFLAMAKACKSPIGCISLEVIDESTGEVGYWISENWKRKGCATELLKALIPWAFNDRGLKKLIATVAVHNFISLKLLQNQGFQIIGQKDLQTIKGTTLNGHLLELNSVLHSHLS